MFIYKSDIPTKNPKNAPNVIKDGKSLHNGNRKQVTAHPTIPTVHKLIADILVLSTIIPGNSLPIVFKTPKLNKLKIE